MVTTSSLAAALVLVVAQPAFNDPGSLAYAARKGNVDRVKQLLDERPDLLNALDEHNRAPLLYAARSGQAEVVDLLFARGPKEPSKLDIYGYAAIHWAAMYAHPDVIRLMVKNKIDIETRNYEKQTPLHLAVGNIFSNVHQQHAEVTRVLLSLGADPNARDRAGRTPLHATASLIGHVPAAKVLLESGKNLDVNAQAAGGETALHGAAFFGKLDLVNLLLDHGANPTLRNRSGETPADLCGKSDFPAAKAITRRLAEAQEALDRKRKESR